MSCLSCRAARWAPYDVTTRGTAASDDEGGSDDEAEWLVVRASLQGPWLPTPGAARRADAHALATVLREAWRTRVSGCAAIVASLVLPVAYTLEAHTHTAAAAGGSALGGHALLVAACLALALAVSHVALPRRVAAEWLLAARRVGVLRCSIDEDGAMRHEPPLLCRDIAGVAVNEGVVACSVTTYIAVLVRAVADPRHPPPPLQRARSDFDRLWLPLQHAQLDDGAIGAVYRSLVHLFPRRKRDSPTSEGCGERS